MTFLLRSGGVALACALAAAPAFAQTPETYDFKPMFDQVIMGVGGLLAAVLTALSAFAIAWVRSKTSLVSQEAADKAQQFFSEKILRAMAYGESVAKDSIPRGGMVTTDNPFIKAAAEFAHTMYPETLGKLNYDELAKAIIARLPSGPLTEKADAITQAKAGAPTATAVAAETVEVKKG